MTDNTGSTTNLYDDAGRLWGIDYPSGASVRYQLDVLDRITAITNKAPANGTAYATRYHYDPIGNVTNVIDPFNGNTKYEYDRVGRRTKRTLPNSVVTEWQYDWRDRVTNITHKIGGTTLASVAYERLAGGEPSKITREDGSFVELKYDSALRLTNEVYYTNSVAQTTNSYAYDASGSRIKLITGATTLTNAVSAGYRITEVKQGSTTVETYGYDNGGRVTSIARDGATLNLGYNTTDQVRAVTNGATWVTYTHDASGRRTMATNNGAIRLFMTAPLPGSELESPHAVFTESGGLRKGYVYVEGQPLCRYDGGGRVFYLEDGMGSVIGLAPESNPDLSNTSRMFYDGFGNVRATSGPAPTFGGPGIRGDFRFHGQWLEGDTGLYHMRAREYDARMGRFTSRDPREGVFQRAETLNPYVYAVNNPHVFTDPSGEFTLIDITAAQAINAGLQALKQIAIHEAKKYIKGKVFEAVSNVVLNQLGNIYPPLGAVWESLKSKKLGEAGRNFERAFKEKVCGAIGVDGPITKLLWFYPGVNQKGEAETPGLNCPDLSAPQFTAGNFYPDFVISEVAPDKTPGAGQSVTIGDFKISGNSLYNQYVKSGPQNKRAQFDAITAYAGTRTYTRTAVFLTVFTGQKKNLRQVAALLGGDGLRKGVVVIVVAAIKNKGFDNGKWE